MEIKSSFSYQEVKQFPEVTSDDFKFLQLLRPENSVNLIRECFEKEDYSTLQKVLRLSLSDFSVCQEYLRQIEIEKKKIEPFLTDFFSVDVARLIQKFIPFDKKKYHLDDFIIHCLWPVFEIYPENLEVFAGGDIKWIEKNLSRGQSFEDLTDRVLEIHEHPTFMDYFEDGVLIAGGIGQIMFGNEVYTGAIFDTFFDVPDINGKIETMFNNTRNRANLLRWFQIVYDGPWDLHDADDIPLRMKNNGLYFFAIQTPSPYRDRALNFYILFDYYNLEKEYDRFVKPLHQRRKAEFRNIEIVQTINSLSDILLNYQFDPNLLWDPMDKFWNNNPQSEAFEKFSIYLNNFNWNQYYNQIEKVLGYKVPRRFQ